jgi:O-antigen/teichoic acid export membrane protein
LGKNDFVKLKQVFANSLSLHVIFILVAIILAETLGLWFLKNKLVIPPERANAAFWVYQFAVMSFSISVFFSPFDGAIRAHEKFSFYAKMSIFDVVMKLVIVYLLVVLPYDKLTALSFLGLCVGIIGRIIVYVYCHKNFEECRIKLSWVKDCIRQLLGYNAYSTLGVISHLIRIQGLNIVLNLYYGPIMNAAQGIANTICTAVTQISSNAMLAAQPQIVMSYATNDRQRFWSLITKSSVLCFYLLLILTFPFILEIRTILYIWLGNYPEYASIFSQLFLLEGMFGALFSPIIIANSAIGKLRATTIIAVVGRLFMLIIAVFIGIKKLSPTYIYVLGIILIVITMIINTIIVLKIQLSFSLRKYCIDVLWPISKTSLYVVSMPIVAHYFFIKIDIVFLCCWNVHHNLEFGDNFLYRA